MGLHRQVGELQRREVRERMGFCMTPNQLHGVQLGSVGRQQLGADAMAIAGEPTFDRFAHMSLEPVPDQGDGHAQRAAQLLEKLRIRSPSKLTSAWRLK